MPNPTLKTKITLTISVLIAALLSILAFSAQFYFTSQIKQMVVSQQYTMVSAIADQLDDKLEATQGDIIATAGTITRTTLDDPKLLKSFLAGRPDDIAQFDNGIFVFSPQGRVLFQVPGGREKLADSPAQWPFLKETLAARSAQISAPFLSPQAPRHPVIMFSAPIFDKAGTIIAVLAGSIDLTRDNFLGKLASVRLGEKGYLYLYNNSRVMIAHPSRERIGRSDVPPGANLLYDKALAGFQGTGETVTSRGIAVLSSFRRLRTTGWILASNFPRSEAYAPIHRARDFVAFALVTVFLFSIVVVWLCMGYLTAPLNSFTRQIRSLANTESDSQARVTVDGADEIGVLGDAFNHLLDELDGQKKELKKQLDFSRIMIDTAPIPIFYKDTQGRYLGCNRAFEEVSGHSSESLIGKTVFDLVPRHLAEHYHRADLRLMQERGTEMVESSVEGADGTEHDIRCFRTTFPGLDDAPAGILGAVLDITDLKKAQSAAEAQKEFAESLVQNSSVPTFVLDRRHRVINWNYACERLTGLKSEDVLGSEELWRVFYTGERPVLADLVIDGKLDLLARYYAVHSVSTLIPDGVHAEAWFTAADGSQHYITMGAAPIRDSSGVLIGAIETIEDITARKQAQDAHEKISRQLQLILDAAGEGIYGIDMEGRVSFVNPAAALMLGWEQEELFGQYQHALAHHTRPDGTPYPAEQCPIYAAFKEGVSHQGAEVFWRRDGSSFPVEFVSTPIREEGAVVGAVVIFKDNTEHNLAEEQLLKLSQAIMQSPVSVIITDPDGKIEYVNPKFTQVTGYSAAEVIGRTPGLLKSGQTPAEVYQSLWGTISSGRVWSGEIFNMQKDGETYWEHATISPIRNGAGVISHYMAFMECVTDRKKLEEQLRHAQKMEAVGQMAGGVAHDFNNILTAIVGFGQLLQYSLEPDDPRRPQMEQILDAADRATHLTKSLLAFSRKQVMLLQQVELNELARKHTKFLVRVIGEDIALKTDFCEKRLFVLADSGQVEQVLMNMATNARDAMPGGGELHISTEPVQLDKEFHQQHGFGTPGPYALIKISDTGTGIDAKTREKIFDPFFTTKAPGRGTGLGLSIVYGIVKQHGGYITISSQCGMGTTFSIYLPIVSGQHEVSRKQATVVPEGGNETILVVEDDPAVRKLVESVLNRFGYSVIAAESGEEAVALFDSRWQDIDLALIDVIMPKMNGAQACELLRLRSPRLKVLFLSGYTADLIQDKGIQVEGIDLIMKPAKPLELAKKVREMLDAG